ncbi:MAG: PEP/pyruvate-binding domain-containing protein, partial [Leptonema sp. (in: bacteria)]
MKYNIYFFGNGYTDAPKIDKMIQGGKGANLLKMTQLGIPVPPGINIPTEYCFEYLKLGKLPDDFMESVYEKLKLVEQATGRKFGDKNRPLLVSVRSGAPVSMPGMMDTILNLGLNEETAIGLIRETQDERFVYDSYRRLIQMFGDVVMEVKHEKFEKTIEYYKKISNAASDTDLKPQTLREIITSYKKIIKDETGKDFPEDPHIQLKMAIESVFRSWNNERAIIYRKIHNIP